MLLAQYRGTSAISKAIKFITRSPYSHSALLFDQGASEAAERLVAHGIPLGLLSTWHPGSVIEAWNDPSAVRNIPSLSEGHGAGIVVDLFEFIQPLTEGEETDLLQALIPELGWPYDWKGVFRFITRHPGNLDKAWFCSELVFYACAQAGRKLFGETEPWEVPPDWIARSPLLRKMKTVVT